MDKEISSFASKLTADIAVLKGSKEEPSDDGS